MYVRDVKGNVDLRIVFELDQLLLYLFIVQEGEFIFPDGYSAGLARFVIQGIIITQVIFIQQFIYEFASFTAEVLFSQ